MKLEINIDDNVCAVTKKVIKDFNTLDDMGFFRKYYCSKKTYALRVLKYKDPYMNAPLAKIGKFLAKHKIF